MNTQQPTSINNIDSPVDKFLQAIRLIESHKDGYVSWTDDQAVRTFVHGFLFHYEHFFRKPDGEEVHLISGKRPCSHGNNCAYALTYNALCTYKIASTTIQNILGETKKPNGEELSQGEKDEFLTRNLVAMTSLLSNFTRQARTTSVDDEEPTSCQKRTDVSRGCGFRHDRIHVFPEIYDIISSMCPTDGSKVPFLLALEAIYQTHSCLPRGTRVFFVSKIGIEGNDNVNISLPVFNDSIFNRPKSPPVCDGKEGKSMLVKDNKLPSLLEQYGRELEAALNA